MESFGNERIVQQGEDWNLDILLSSSSTEYVPFIISNQRTNPFFVLTIASTKYEKNLRYVKSWWNAVEDESRIPTFYQTTPYEYGSVVSINNLPSLPPIINGSQETLATRLLYQYTIKDELINPDTNHSEYYYFYFEYDGNGNVTNRVDGYECRLRFNILSSETAKWGSQNYMYQITLVNGELLPEVLHSIALLNGMPKDWPKANEEDFIYNNSKWSKAIEAQYKYVKERWPDALQGDIDVTSPLGIIDNPEPILRPSKLQVFNNLREII